MAGQIPWSTIWCGRDEPHLVAQECANCGARFFDRRNACANCFATDFKTVSIATEGTVRAFTIVAFAAPGIPPRSWPLSSTAADPGARQPGQRRDAAAPRLKPAQSRPSLLRSGMRAPDRRPPPSRPLRPKRSRPPSPPPQTSPRRSRPSRRLPLNQGRKQAGWLTGPRSRVIKTVFLPFGRIIPDRRNASIARSRFAIGGGIHQLLPQNKACPARKQDP